jgi:hypothetical protein
VDEFYYWSPTGDSTLATAITSNAPNGGTTTIHVADDSAFAAVGAKWTTNYVFQIGGYAHDVVEATKTSTDTYTTTTPIVNNYPVGASVKFAQTGHFSFQTAPPYEDIWYYANWIPASQVNIGVPDTAGWNSGAVDMNYAAGPAISGQPKACTTNPSLICAPLIRRDFTNAVILMRPFQYNVLANELETYSIPINLVDSAHDLAGPYYRLNADGTTGPAITSVELRAGEAAILMK